MILRNPPTSLTHRGPVSGSRFTARTNLKITLWLWVPTWVHSPGEGASQEAAGARNLASHSTPIFLIYPTVAKVALTHVQNHGT